MQCQYRINSSLLTKDKQKSILESIRWCWTDSSILKRLVINIMRQNYNVLLIPFFKTNDEIKFCIFKRSDLKIWQFVAGGGEGQESIFDSALRELEEETGIKSNYKSLFKLESMASVIIAHFPELANLPQYVIPVYSFSYCVENLKINLSKEHVKYMWLSYEEAFELLHFDLDKTALWELNQRIKKDDF